MTDTPKKPIRKPLSGPADPIDPNLDGDIDGLTSALQGGPVRVDWRNRFDDPAYDKNNENRRNGRS